MTQQESQEILELKTDEEHLFALEEALFEEDLFGEEIVDSLFPNEF